MGSNNEKWFLGLMSGTSLDGIDAAMIRTDGQQILEFGRSDYLEYTDAEQNSIRAGFGCWQDADGVSDIARLIEGKHFEIASNFPEADYIGFHGQTLAHDPDNGRTHQCGDGAALAERLGKTVIWDFRSNDVAMGGQGAPLAPVFHHAMVQYSACREPVAILNLGGVGNITFVDPMVSPENGLLAFDTGPANAPINDQMLASFGKAFDDGGKVAAQGQADQLVVERFLNNAYFHKMPPKSLDRDDFKTLVQDCAKLTPQNAIATLTSACVHAVGQGMEFAPNLPSQLWVTGGGRKNTTLMTWLADTLRCRVSDIDDKGFDGDMVEAQAFGYLAARVLNGLPTSFPSTTHVPAAVGGGIISRP